VVQHTTTVNADQAVIANRLVSSKAAPSAKLVAAIADNPMEVLKHTIKRVPEFWQQSRRGLACLQSRRQRTQLQLPVFPLPWPRFRPEEAFPDNKHRPQSAARIALPAANPYFMSSLARPSRK
jgi:hypothetical protein